ncbi:hypothetical protein, partial [Mariniblastus fucicola]|uniref:hypothetical protein n=1 Tax=Mariniblastus fucicola TaxID=980251 RepID=UPI001EE4AFCE
ALVNISHTVQVWMRKRIGDHSGYDNGNDYQSLHLRLLKRDNVNVHRAAAKDLQAEKAARPAAPCATYCYVAIRYV